MGGARNRGVRARRAKAASCCIDCIVHEHLSGNVPKIYLAGQTTEHSVASEYHSQCLVLRPRLKYTNCLGFVSTSSVWHECLPHLSCCERSEVSNAVLSKLTMQQPLSSCMTSGQHCLRSVQIAAWLENYKKVNVTAMQCLMSLCRPFHSGGSVANEDIPRTLSCTPHASLFHHGYMLTAVNAAYCYCTPLIDCTLSSLLVIGVTSLPAGSDVRGHQPKLQ